LQLDICGTININTHLETVQRVLEIEGSS